MEYTIRVCDGAICQVLVWGDREMVDPTACRSFANLGDLREFVRTLRSKGLKAI